MISGPRDPEAVEFGLPPEALSLFLGMVTERGGRGSQRGDGSHTLPKWMQQVEGVNTGWKCKRCP